MRTFALVFVAAGAVACGAAPESTVEMAPSRVAPSEPVITRAPRRAYVPPSSCTDALFAHAAMIANGRGENHPERIAVEAKLATCPRPLAPSAEACAAVRRLRAEHVVDYGPNHPFWREQEAREALCADKTTAAPDLPSCAEAKARHDALVVAGKGERHPLVLAAERDLVRCAP